MIFCSIIFWMFSLIYGTPLFSFPFLGRPPLFLDKLNVTVNLSKDNYNILFHFNQLSSFFGTGLLLCSLFSEWSTVTVGEFVVSKMLSHSSNNFDVVFRMFSVLLTNLFDWFNKFFSVPWLSTHPRLLLRLLFLFFLLCSSFPICE